LLTKQDVVPPRHSSEN